MNILVFGTGKTFEELEFKRNVKIIAFLDNNIAKIGTLYKSVPVIDPKDAINYDFDYIVIASASFKSMIKQLENYGIRCELLIPAYIAEDKKKAYNLGIIHLPLSAKMKYAKRTFFFLLTKLFKLLLIRDNNIIYNCQWGKNYNCNPKAIYEYLINNRKGYKHIWILNDISKAINIPTNSYNKTIFVKAESLKYLYYMCVSKFWIINANNKIASFKAEQMLRNETVVLQTWHAAGAFKIFGAHRGIEINIRYDYVLCSGVSVRDIYAESLKTNIEKVKCIGLPRTDILVKSVNDAELRGCIYKKYNLDPGKKTLLYAPTYRDARTFSPYLDLNKLCKILGPEWQLLLRWHHIVESRIEIEGLDNVIHDVSDEDDINHFLIISDALITDYSSIIFEYAFFGRPIIFYAYDFDCYSVIRDFYFGYEGFVPGPIAKTPEELYSLAENIESIRIKYKDKLLEFSTKYLSPMDGKACERAVRLLDL